MGSPSLCLRGLPGGTYIRRKLSNDVVFLSTFFTNALKKSFIRTHPNDAVSPTVTRSGCTVMDFSFRHKSEYPTELKFERKKLLLYLLSQQKNASNQPFEFQVQLWKTWEEQQACKHKEESTTGTRTIKEIKLENNNEKHSTCNR